MIGRVCFNKQTFFAFPIILSLVVPEKGTLLHDICNRNRMFDYKIGCMENISTQKIEKAFHNDCCGGRLKPICNRRMDGYKCRCYARYVIVDGIQYWKIYYLINQREVKDADYRYLVLKMYKIVGMAISMLQSKGVEVVIYQNNIPK